MKVQETGKNDKHDHNGSQELATITYEVSLMMLTETSLKLYFSFY